MSDQIDRTVAAIRPADAAARDAAAAEMGQKLKPPGSLGRLETLAARLAGIRGTADPGTPTPTVVVCAADHGVAADGVSAFPQQVTGLMVDSFAAGGAAVCVLAREQGARLIVADLGVLEPRDHPAVLDRRVRAGTASSLTGPAMSREEAETAVGHGIGMVEELVADGVDLIALGEMGIGNTTAASALTALLLGLPAAEVVGRGTGLDDEQLAHKVDVVDRIVRLHSGLPSDGVHEARSIRPAEPAAERNPSAEQPTASVVRAPADGPTDPLDALAAVGGLEIAALVGVVLGCAAHRVPVVVDGFITGSAALVAARLAPDSVDAMIAGHRSVEPGHTVQLTALGLDPVLDLELRLGEGSGATLALGVLRSALAILSDMATFESIGL